MIITLDENHIYRVNGTEKPSVSKILEEARLSDFSKVKDKKNLEDNQLFGNAVHKMIELDCHGKLNIAKLDEKLFPYRQGWLNFVEDYGYKFIRAEIRGYNPIYEYCYTVDQEGEITKGKYIGLAIGDIKSGKPYPSHKYQLNGGYKLAFGKTNTFILYLDPEYKPRGYKITFGTLNTRDQAVFLSALTIYNVRKTEGLL